MTTTLMRARGRVPRRIAMVTVHTSPLDQPGTGDAGGMNVYVVELSRRLAALGVARVSWGILLHGAAMARFEEQLASLQE